MENNSTMLLTAWEKCASALMCAIREADAKGDSETANTLEDAYFNLSESLLEGISDYEIALFRGH